MALIGKLLAYRLVCPSVPGHASDAYRFGDLLALARRSWIQQVRALTEAEGFPGYRRADALLLRILSGDPMPIGQIGEAVGVTRQAARQLADGLVARGYATFGADPKDARRKLVVLTPNGADYAMAVAKAQGALNDAIRQSASLRDLQVADRVLRSVFMSAGARRRADEWVAPPAR
jgi:DNA-binding MarR family transcriptional regulator